MHICRPKLLEKVIKNMGVTKKNRKYVQKKNFVSVGKNGKHG